MKGGDLFLVEEMMSLAETVAPERPNSVLEPTCILTLAEKGDAPSSKDSGKG